MRAMKDSGVEWIGEIPEGWSKYLLFQLVAQVKTKNENLQETNLLSLSYGKIKRKSIDTVEGLLPESFDGYNIIEKDDIVLRLTDLQNDHTSLRVGLVQERGIITSAYLTLRNRSNNSSAYLYYLLHSFDIVKGFYGMGAGVRQGLNWEGLKNFELFLPPAAEQQRIAAYLDDQCGEIDKVLAKTRESIEEYKKLKQSVITEAVTKGIRPDRHMKPSGIEWIGDIPAEWEVRPLKSLGAYRNGLTYAPENIVEAGSGTLVLRSSNIQNGKIELKDNVFVAQEIPEQLRVKAGDILICSRNGSRDLIGKNAIIPAGVEASFGAFMMIFRSEFPRYMYYILNSTVFSYYLGSFLTATINQLTGKNFGGMNIVFCPNEQERKEIVSHLDQQCAEIDRLIAKKEQIITELEGYKKSLIYECVTGKREVE